MRHQSLAADVLVIGAGLSGMAAAAAAAEAGARVTLLASGHGVMELASGSIDLLGATGAGEPVERPFAALSGLPAGHPYRLLGPERVREALAAFERVAARMESPYRAPADREQNQWAVSPVGRLRRTYLAHPGSVNPVGARSIWVAGLRGMREFNPDVVAAGLRQSLPGVAVSATWLDLPAGEGLHPIQAARSLDRPAGRAALAEALTAGRPEGPAPDLLLLPAVLGIDHGDLVRAAAAQAAGAAVGEVPLLSPSVPGLRLAALWRRHLERVGVDLRIGVRVTAAVHGGGRVESIEAEAAGGTVRFEPGRVILAAGGLLGNGLRVDGRHLEEPVFGLPVAVPAGEWAAPQLLPPDGQPFARAGVRTGPDLRPDGWQNLWVCGRMLAGYDPYAEGSGGGVALGTGWLAGRLAGGANG